MPFIIYIYEWIHIKGQKDTRGGKLCDECLRGEVGRGKGLWWFVLALFPGWIWSSCERMLTGVLRAYFYRNHCYPQNISSSIQNQDYFKTWYRLGERWGFYIDQERSGGFLFWFFWQLSNSLCLLMSEEMFPWANLHSHDVNWQPHQLGDAISLFCIIKEAEVEDT